MPFGGCNPAALSLAFSPRTLLPGLGFAIPRSKFAGQDLGDLPSTGCILQREATGTSGTFTSPSLDRSLLVSAVSRRPYRSGLGRGESGVVHMSCSIPSLWSRGGGGGRFEAKLAEDERLCRGRGSLNAEHGLRDGGGRAAGVPKGGWGVLPVPMPSVMPVPSASSVLLAKRAEALG